MNDPTPTTDEQLSAYLDGEAPPEEAAAVEARLAADPAVRARLEALRSAAAAVAAPVPPPPAAVRERALAAAMATAGTAFAGAMAAAGTAVGGDMAAAGPVVDGDRDRPVAAPVELDLARRRRRSVAVMSAAAVLLVVALAVPLVRSLSGPGDDSGDETAAMEAEEPDGADDASAGAEQSTADSETADATMIQDLGELASPEAVVAAVRPAAAMFAQRSDEDADVTIESEEAGGEAENEGEDGAEGATGAGAGAGAQRCGTEAAAAVGDGAGPLALAATATFQGQPAYVLAFGPPEGDLQVVVLSVDGCRALAGPLLAPR